MKVEKMTAEDRKGPAFPYSYHDCWPWPIDRRDGRSAETLIGVYRRVIEIFLNADFLPQCPLTDDALMIIDKHLPRLFSKKRWRDYRVKEMGDMNVGSHTLRQAGITAQALYFDADILRIGFKERDYMVAAAILHDLGELAVSDITYDIKQKGRQAVELAESKAVMKMINDFEEVNNQERFKLKEVYLRITTSLGNEEIAGLLQGEPSAKDQVNFSQLGKMFLLYERYGYLITSLQQWPLPFLTKESDLSPEELSQIRNWNRSELVQAFKNGQPLSEGVRSAILLKNVLLNQWGPICEAAKEGIPSARIFFDNNWSRPFITSVNELMQLGLDLSPIFSKASLRVEFSPCPG